MTSAKAEATIVSEVKLLQGLLNSNSHGNGHADHGVVTCAQEAHHLNRLPFMLINRRTQFAPKRKFEKMSV